GVHEPSVPAVGAAARHTRRLRGADLRGEQRADRHSDLEPDAGADADDAADADRSADRSGDADARRSVAGDRSEPLRGGADSPRGCRRFRCEPHVVQPASRAHRRRARARHRRDVRAGARRRGDAAVAGRRRVVERCQAADSGQLRRRSSAVRRNLAASGGDSDVRSGTVRRHPRRHAPDQDRELRGAVHRFGGRSDRRPSVDLSGHRRPGLSVRALQVRAPANRHPDALRSGAVGLKVTVVGSQDRELEAVLRACGATPTAVPIAELGALAQPSYKQPDLVVLDLRQHAGVPPGLAALKRQHGGTGVVIIAQTLAPELILSAMRAGANECVAEPVTQGELDAAITRVVARQSAPTASQAFAIVGVKGGVGATSVAINVATALARVASAGALLIDLHVARGEAALYLGIEPRFTVVDALDNIHKLDDAFFRSLVVRAPSRLDLLAAPDAIGAARLDGSRLRTLL